MDFRIPIGQWVETVVDWLRDNLSGLFDFITVVVRFLVDGLTDILLIIPIPAMIVVFALIGWLVRSWQMAVGTVLAFVFIIAMDLWIPTMQTLSLVLVATVVALAIAIPLGIWSARNDTVRTILKPVLDFMQTMPAFVYLIPAITFFSIGVVPGLVATVIFALPPGVRLTELGTSYLINQVMHAEPVMRSERARALVQEALLYLTEPAQRATLASPRTEPRRSTAYRASHPDSTAYRAPEAPMRTLNVNQHSCEIRSACCIV